MIDPVPLETVRRLLAGQKHDSDMAKILRHYMELRERDALDEVHKLDREHWLNREAGQLDLSQDPELKRLFPELYP